MDDLGVPLFSETSKFIYQIISWKKPVQSTSTLAGSLVDG